MRDATEKRASDPVEELPCFVPSDLVGETQKGCPAGSNMTRTPSVAGGRREGHQSRAPTAFRRRGPVRLRSPPRPAAANHRQPPTLQCCRIMSAPSPGRNAPRHDVILTAPQVEATRRSRPGCKGGEADAAEALQPFVDATAPSIRRGAGLRSRRSGGVIG